MLLLLLPAPHVPVPTKAACRNLLQDAILCCSMRTILQHASFFPPHVCICAYVPMRRIMCMCRRYNNFYRATIPKALVHCVPELPRLLLGVQPAKHRHASLVGLVWLEERKELELLA